MNRKTVLAAGAALPVLLLAAALASGCADSGAAWTGTVTDSAGVSIVSNPAASEWISGAPPAIEEELRIGTAGGDPNYQFAQIVALDVAADGSIYVLDQQAATVRVYDGAGQFVREFGRKGSGPGELTQGIMGLMLGPGGTILVPDPLAQRITIFNSDGSPAGEFAMSFTDGIPLRFEQLPDRRVVQHSRIMALPGQAQAAVEPMDRLLVRDTDGVLSDTLLVFASGGTFDFGGGAAPRIRIFEPEPMWTLGLDGKLYFANNATYSIEVRGQDGQVERIIRAPFERKSVTEEDKQAFHDAIMEMFVQQGLPQEAVSTMSQMISFADHYPAFANLMGGPANTLWVQHVRTAAEALALGRMDDPRDMGSPIWDVFDGEGRLLGSVELPDRFTPLHIGDDELWGIVRDELDVQYVVRYGISGLPRS
ncbi:MAG: 6-bladed beta-propeller [Gemmatimonadetes bacterium]|nr:6-bladed beta-propeller [Gemmatimonadota bacterium]